MALIAVQTGPILSRFVFTSTWTSNCCMY